MASVAQVKGYAWIVLPDAFLSPCLTINGGVCYVPRKSFNFSTYCTLLAPSSPTHIYTCEARASPLMCCIFAALFRWIVCTDFARRAGLRSCALTETLHPRSRGAIKFLENALAWLLAANGYIVYFLASSLHCELLHGINFDELHRTGSTSNVG